MEFPIFFPELKRRSTKDRILRILSEESGLTNKELHLQLRKRFKSPVTYQAVRQALCELTADKVLEKTERTYTISPAWVSTLHEYSMFLKKRFVDKRDVTIIDEHTKEVRLRSLNDMGNFLLHSFRDEFFDTKGEHDLYMFLHHLWFPFFDKEKRALLDRFFGANDNHIYVKSKSLLDRVFLLYYRRFARVKLGVRFDEFCDIIVQGDCVVKIHVPRELREKMDTAYKRGLFTFSQIDSFSQMAYHQYPIVLVITRDIALAQDMKSQMRG